MISHLRCNSICFGIYFTPTVINELNYNLKKKSMRSILYIIAVILVISWLVGYFAYSATGLIHILLVIAIISLLLGVIQGRSV
jgi:hypothetical protein